MALSLEDPSKGFVLFAADCIVCDDDGVLYPDAEERLRAHTAEFYSLVSTCEGCWGVEFLAEGSEAATPLFYVVDPYGDRLSSLLSSKESEPALAYRELGDALQSPGLAENKRIFACIGFVFEEQFIEIEDFNREIDGDGEPMENLPTLSQQLPEGIEVYLKQPEEMGDPGKVFSCAWMEGKIEEEEIFDFAMGESLANVLA